MRLRKKLFNGVIENPHHGRAARAFARAQGRIGLELDRSRTLGLSQIIVSDENMMGLMQHNISTQTLYPKAGARIARFVRAFRGSVKMICLNTRCLSSYWTSALNFSIPRGVMVPDQARIDALAQQQRNWRDVISDIAEAAPDIPIFVSAFEHLGARPHVLTSYLLGTQTTLKADPVWQNRRPTVQELLRLPLCAREQERLTAHIEDNRWKPFSSAQRAALQERYADDLFWLRSGSDGCATYLEDPRPLETGYPAQMGFVNKGQSYDTRQRLARPS
jgi:hypothetical protein